VEGVDQKGLKELANPSGKAIQPKSETDKPEAPATSEEAAPAPAATSESANQAKPVD